MSKNKISGNACSEVPVLVYMMSYIFDGIYKVLRDYLWVKQIYVAF